MTAHTPTPCADGEAGFLDPLERLVFEGLDRADGDCMRALELLCREHPEQARAIRERLQGLRSMGIEDDEPLSTQALPERLGDFRLICKLGGGGMGVVYLARQESLSREVALKLIRPEYAYFEGSRERFHREMQAAGRLEHEGIVRVYAVGEEQGVPFMAMERVRGCTLGEALADLEGRRPEQLTGRDLHALVSRRAGATSGEGAAPALFAGSWVESCLRIVQRVAAALAHAHGHGILHRDVKPSNVMVTPTGRVLLVDLGLAHVQGSKRITATGSTIGSVPYVTPEQVASGNSSTDPRADVYALGVTLYELLALGLPFWSASTERIRQLILNAAPVPLRQRNRAVHRDVELVCATAMERDPGRRYPDAEAFARDIGNLLALRPIEARPPDVALRAWRWAQRHRTLASTGLVSAALLVVAAAALWWTAVSAGWRIQLLQDASLVEALRAQVDGIRPIWPEDTGEADRWMEQFSALRQRIRQYQAQLASLEQRALPPLEGEETPSSVPRQVDGEDLHELRDWFVQGPATNPGWHPYQYTSDEVQKAVAEQDEALRRAEPPRFRDSTDAERYRLLTSVCRQWTGLAEGAAALQERREHARLVDRVCLQDHASVWRETILAIADSSANPAYGGLRLQPQRGLVPIGQDPRSGLFEFVHLPTGVPPSRDAATGELRPTPETGLVLVLLPGAHFVMGSAQLAHVPPREVETTAFFLSKYEMTQGQWQRVTGRNPSRYRAGSTYGDRTVTGRNPVEWVNWHECDAVLRRLGLALPTEAQWEYGARGGTDTAWWCGHEERELEGAGNLRDLASYRAYPGRQRGDPLPWDDGYVYHAPVGTFRANPFGLHDVIGNVKEWCRETHWMLPHEVTEWEAHMQEVRFSRRIRGSHFMDTAFHSQHATYFYALSISKSNFRGVRPAREI